jgi:hypothetical protein
MSSGYRQAIVTTTVSEPTPALLKFLSFKDWTVLVVGDLKTPHVSYLRLQERHSNLKYLHPEYQDRKYKELSDVIGWNCIQRRNIGFLEAFNLGFDVVATVDDDNMPKDDWGKHCVGQTVEVKVYGGPDIVCDPLAVTNQKHLWHRGFPLELLSSRHNVKCLGMRPIKVLVQADLWDGHPDIDAVCRLTFSNPRVVFDTSEPYCFQGIVPFNSQNTFIHSSLLPMYAMIPFCGRIDDIWGAYLLQHFLPSPDPFIIFNRASVVQDRALHSFGGQAMSSVDDLEKELLHYRKTFRLLTSLDGWKHVLGEKMVEFVECYRKSFIPHPPK